MFWFNYLSVILDSLCYLPWIVLCMLLCMFWMILIVMLYVCENASMSIYPHACDDMLHEFMGVVKIPNIKLLKKNFKKFHENLSKFTSEKDDLIAKLNESNKLV